MSDDKKRRVQKRNAISLETKMTILDRLAKGEGSTSLGKEFGLGESTIRAIKKNEDPIRKSVISGTKLSAKVSSYSRGILKEKMEKALVVWIEDLTRKQIHLEGCLIKQTALEIYKQIREMEPSASSSQDNNLEFRASTGWLTGFLKRHALRKLKINGEGSSVDEESPKNYPKQLTKMIEDGGYCHDKILNVDETGVYWEQIPNIAESETTASNCKTSDDGVLKPLIVNKSRVRKGCKGADRSDDDLIKLALDTAKDLDSAPLTASLIQEGLELASKLENHFLTNDKDSDRALKFQRQLKCCISDYQELHESLVKQASQSLITDYFMKDNKVTRDEREILVDPTCILTIAYDDKNDVPVPKRKRVLSDNIDKKPVKIK